ncbi:hypothetical protein ACOSP7_021663 [Xanthoceras sorbifolium]
MLRASRDKQQSNTANKSASCRPRILEQLNSFKFFIFDPSSCRPTCGNLLRFEMLKNLRSNLDREMRCRTSSGLPWNSNDSGGRNEPGSLGVNGNTCGGSGVEENMRISGGADVNSSGGNSCSGGGRNEPGSLGVNGNTCGGSGVEENMGTSGGAGVKIIGRKLLLRKWQNCREEGWC